MLVNERFDDRYLSKDNGEAMHRRLFISTAYGKYTLDFINKFEPTAEKLHYAFVMLRDGFDEDALAVMLESPLSGQDLVEMMDLFYLGISLESIKFLAKTYTGSQLCEIKEAVKSGVELDVIKVVFDPKLSPIQFLHIRRGLEDGLTVEEVSSLAEYSWRMMRHERYGFYVKKGVFTPSAEIGNMEPVGVGEIGMNQLMKKFYEASSGSYRARICNNDGSLYPLYAIENGDCTFFSCPMTASSHASF